MKFYTSVLFASLLGSASAWVLSKENIQKATAAAGISAALVASPLPGMAFDSTEIAGYYNDPNHPNCQRIIEVAAPKATISGTEGNPGCPANGSGRVWTLYGKVKGDSLSVDFSPKGGPRSLEGTYDASSELIQWKDGNQWTKTANK